MSGFSCSLARPTHAPQALLLVLVKWTRMFGWVWVWVYGWKNEKRDRGEREEGRKGGREEERKREREREKMREREEERKREGGREGWEEVGVGPYDFFKESLRALQLFHVIQHHCQMVHLSHTYTYTHTHTSYSSTCRWRPANVSYRRVLFAYLCAQQTSSARFS